MSKVTGDGSVFLTEKAAADTDVAGDGQIWVKTATPNVLKFTDDAGTDQDLLTNTNIANLTTETTTDPTADYLVLYDATDSAANKITPSQFTSNMGASQAQMEAGSVTGAIVNPAVQQFHPSAAKIWLNFDPSSGTPTIQSSYNVTSITDNGVGNYGVVIANNFSLAYQCIVLSAGLSGYRCASDLATKTSIGVGSFSVITSNQTSGALIDASVATAVGYGDQ